MTVPTVTERTLLFRTLKSVTGLPICSDGGYLETRQIAPKQLMFGNLRFSRRFVVPTPMPDSVRAERRLDVTLVTTLPIVDTESFS